MDRGPLPACDDGLDSDGDGLIDFDGGLSVLGAGHPDLTLPDPQCKQPWGISERPPPAAWESARCSRCSGCGYAACAVADLTASKPQRVFVSQPSKSVVFGDEGAKLWHACMLRNTRSGTEPRHE